MCECFFRCSRYNCVFIVLNYVYLVKYWRINTTRLTVRIEACAKRRHFDGSRRVAGNNSTVSLIISTAGVTTCALLGGSERVVSLCALCVLLVGASERVVHEVGLGVIVCGVQARS